MQSEHPLHVAVVAPVFPVLSETFVLDHVTGLRDRGVRVTVVASGPSTDEPRHPGARDLDVDRIVRRPLPTSTLARARLVASAVRPLGPRRLAAAVLRSRREHVGLTRAVVESTTLTDLPGDVDVVHSHFGPVGATVLGALREAGRDVPVVTTFHGYDVSIRDDIDRVYAGLFRDPRSLLLTVSDRWRRVLTAAGAHPERTKVLRQGIDLGAYEYAPAARTGGPLRVLSVGRLVEKKGFLDAADAVAAAAADGHDLVWTVIGGGPERQRLEERVARHDLADRVTLMGPRTRNEVGRAMRASHVMLAPSRTASNGNMEGIPVVLMEAMASGLPVVSTHHSGIPELVVDERSGLLVSEGDVDALSRCLGLLDRDEPLRRRLAAAGRERVDELHDADKQLDTLLAHYRSLMSAPLGSTGSLGPTLGTA